jgi:hypothetical protein
MWMLCQSIKRVVMAGYAVQPEIFTDKAALTLSRINVIQQPTGDDLFKVVRSLHHPKPVGRAIS